MTFTNSNAAAFGKFYNYFSKYWNFKRNRNGYHNQFQIDILTSILYMLLHEEWSALGQDIDELKWICVNLDYNNELLDPYNFIGDESAYVDHAKTCSYLEKKMNELSLCEAFDKGHCIHLEYISKVQNYIAGNLISWYPNRSFWQAEYNYATKLYEVCHWKKELDMQPMAKKGEAICSNELANFFKDEKHKGCHCSTV